MSGIVYPPIAAASKVPSPPSDATQFLNGAATPAFAQVKDADLATTDVTTNNASTSKHGFLKKLDNNAAHFMDGTGNWTTPPGNVPTQQILTTGTTYTPTAGTVAILVEIWGAGGGGGGSASGIGATGAGGGGGAGGYCRKFYSSIAASYTYAIGQKGTGGAAGQNDGLAGGDTTFDVMTAKGGGLGKGSAAGALGIVAGGTSSISTGGDADGNGCGMPGGAGLVVAASLGVNGQGGSTTLGAGGQQLAVSGTGINGIGPGCGGSGGLSLSNGGTKAGGDGVNGIVRVTEFS